MTQGDVFHEMGEVSISANSTKKVTITPAAGTQVMASELMVGTRDWSNEGWGAIYPYDAAANNPITSIDNGAEQANPRYGRYKETGQGSLTSAKVPLDDEKGVQCHFQNADCGSLTTYYVVGGIEVK